MNVHLSRPILGSLLLFALVFSPTSLSNAATATPSPSPSPACVSLTQFTWIVRIPKRTLQRIGNADTPTSFCAPLYTAGTENVLLELRDKSGKVAFSRKIFLNLMTYFDDVGKDGRTRGSVRKNDSPSFTTYIPWSSARPGNHRLRLTEIEGGKVLAEGAP